jgi:ketosteroid isomerase-like protein
MGANADLMSGYFEIVDRAVQSGDFEEWLSTFSEDVVWEAVEDAPDAGTYRGHAGLRSYFEDWLQIVDEMRFEAGEVTEVGDFVVSDTRARAKIKGTDAPIDIPYVIAARIADGKIVQGKEFRERDDALAYAKANSSTTG